MKARLLGRMGRSVEVNFEGQLAMYSSSLRLHISATAFSVEDGFLIRVTARYVTLVNISDVARRSSGQPLHTPIDPLKVISLPSEPIGIKWKTALTFN